MPAWHYNENYEERMGDKARNVVRWTGKNLGEVTLALEAVKRRTPEQHWREALKEMQHAST